MEALTAALAGEQASRPAKPARSCAAGGSSSDVGGVPRYHNGAPPGASGTEDARDLQEHVVLLQFSAPALVGTTKGIEVTPSSRNGPMPSPVEVGGPRYHDFLTVKLVSFAASAE